MSFAVWSSKPQLLLRLPEQMYQVGAYWVVTDDPAKATIENVNALLATYAQPDYSNIDNLDKTIKAIGLCIAQVGGLTAAQIKALFKTKWDSLP